MVRMLQIIMIFWVACSWQVHAETLKVVTENWRPYNYFEDGEVKGIATEMLKKVLDNTDIDYQIEVLPWARAYHRAQHEPNTLIYVIIRIPPRENLFKWVRPMGTGGKTSLYRLKSKPQVMANNLEEAKQLLISTNRDSMDHLWLTNNGFTQLETPSKVSSAIHMFFNHRVDAIAFDNTVMESEFEKNGYQVEEVEPILQLFTTPPYMAVSPSTSDEIVKKIQKSYDELMEQNAIKLVN